MSTARLALAALALLVGMGCQGLSSVPFVASEPHAWELPPTPAEDRPVVDPDKLHRSRLPNGLEVVVLVDRRLPRFDLGLMTRRGAAVVPVERAGLASFTTELMERGAGDRSALELAAVVDGLGGSLSVGVDWDSAVASIGGLARDFDTLFSVLGDVVLRPRFDDDEVVRVRSEQLAGLEKAREDPTTLASWNFARVLYDGHIYGVPSAGTPETVAALDAAAARAWHARVFVPANAIFFAVGDVDPAAILRRVEATYGGWQGGEIPDEGPPPPPSPGRRVVVVDRPDLNQVQVMIGHPGITRTEPRRIPIQVMNTILGSAGFSSRLMAKIRGEEGLTYGIWSQFAGRRRVGPFVVSSFTRVPEVGRLVELSLAELERIREDPPSADELAAAKSLLAGRFALGLETSTAVISGLVDLDVHGLPADSLDTYRGRIRAATEAEVAAAARDFVRPDEAVIVAVGPADAVVPQLERFGPVSVVEP